jgi:hypothetical protein
MQKHILLLRLKEVLINWFYDYFHRAIGVVLRHVAKISEQV